ncbi:hypothetical protein OG429_29560 [Streptomyces sp. NBC_00190]|uniref:hypothetical protein n=1 Tax=Streptomyces sp. NBC_00190 TaxID=2903634 RepID=UPI002E2C35E4|nr:hypothetical protein [Streptomyces sp. NBC_00190]
MKLSLTVHRARLGTEEFQVIRPARPPRRAVLLDDSWYLNAYVDQVAARLMAGLWTLAASSPRSLIHLPLRGSRPDAASRGLDLVLLHHSLQFAPSRWKELRGRLGPGRPRSVELSVPEPGTGLAALHHAENRDVLRQHIHAGTLFVTGSAKVFHEAADVLRRVAEDGPGHVRDGSRHGHCCAQVRCGDARARDIHVEYTDEWAAA